METGITEILRRREVYTQFDKPNSKTQFLAIKMFNLNWVFELGFSNWVKTLFLAIREKALAINHLKSHDTLNWVCRFGYKPHDAYEHVVF